MPARLPLMFLTLAATGQVAGVTLGLYMGARQDFALAPIHGHVNLMVWASLALYGLVWRAWPDLGPAWSAWLHLILAGVGAALFPFWPGRGAHGPRRRLDRPSCAPVVCRGAPIPRSPAAARPRSGRLRAVRTPGTS